MRQLEILDPPCPTFFELELLAEALYARGCRPGWHDGNGDSFVDELDALEISAVSHDGEVIFAESPEELLAFLDFAALGSSKSPVVPGVGASAARLEAFPITIGEAKRFCAQHHSHLKPPTGALFAVGILNASVEALCCVAIVGRPSAPAFGGLRIAEITRVASDGTPHAASKAIALATRLARLQGYRRIISYTLEHEAGTCYRAAGWHPVARSPGGQWSRPGRIRSPAEQSGPKIRWETGPDAGPPDPTLAAPDRAHFRS